MVAATVGLGAPLTGSADTSTSGAAAVPTSVGACVSPASLTLSFTSPVPLNPSLLGGSLVGVTLGGSATCLGSAGLATMTPTLNGNLPVSCTGLATGTMSGQINWTPAPPSQNVNATVVMGPESFHLVIAGPTMYAEGSFAWSVPFCTGNAMTAQLVGAMLFAAG